VVLHSQAIVSLARVKPLVFLEKHRESKPGENVLVSVLKEAEVTIPMASMVDIEAEKIRLQKEIDQNQAEANRLDARLQDSQFLSKAPAAIVEKEKAKQVMIKDKLHRLKQELDRLQ
jgi:valyl-tRNA synthetase